MKSFVLLSIIFALHFSINARASGYDYECNCYPGKGEKSTVCDGQENLKLHISSTGKRMTAEMGSYDWEMSDTYNTVLDKIPTPRGYAYYRTTSGGGGYEFTSDFLVEKILAQGGRKLKKCTKGGFVEALTSDENDETYTTNYVCCLLK